MLQQLKNLITSSAKEEHRVQIEWVVQEVGEKLTPAAFDRFKKQVGYNTLVGGADSSESVAFKLGVAHAVQTLHDHYLPR